MASGNAVREAINQGFTRAEMGSLADKQVTQVYKGAHAEGSVVASKCTNAIENYKAAVACFLRALPSLEDERSANLVREEVRRLLARLGELKAILRSADPSNDLLLDDDDANGAVKNRLLQDLRFEVGDEVDVDGKRPARIAAVDLEQGLYTVEYDDGQGERESGVTEPRVRLRSRQPDQAESSDQHEGFGSEAEAERYRLWSEVVESERVFQRAMQHLMRSYVIPFDNPAQHAGAKSRSETLFSQAAISKDERARIFGNVEDLVGIAQIALTSLEARFEQWHADQRLADVFLELASMYTSAYPLYAEAQAEGLNVLRRIRAEQRSGVASVEMRALALGAPPLDELLRLPLLRPAQLRKLLQDLARRTPDEHPDMAAIRDAFVLFGRVEEAMRLSLDRAKLEKQVAEIESQFSPALKLQKKGRYLVKFSDHLTRIEGASSAKRLVWLFSDILIVGRKSEWLSVGSYRHLGQIAILKARASPEYGPLSFEVTGTTETFVFVAANDEEKHEWLKALRGFIPRSTSIGKARKKSVAAAPQSTAAPPPPPPPIQPTIAPPKMTAPPISNVMPRDAPGASGMPGGGGIPTAFTMASKAADATPGWPAAASGSAPQVPGWPASSPPGSAAVPGWADSGARSQSPSSPSKVLGTATMRQKEILLQKKRAEGWFRAQAIADFVAMEIGDLTFRKGDVLEISPEESSPGWTRGRLMGGDGAEGAVPSAYVQRLS